MRVRIGEEEYEVRTRAKAWPLLAYLQRLTSPRSAEEAEKLGEELERVVDRIMELCVSPRPSSDEHKAKLLMAILRAEDRIVREAGELAENFQR